MDPEPEADDFQWLSYSKAYNNFLNSFFSNRRE